MYAPLGAISAFGRGAVQGYTEDSPKNYDLMGMEALGKAFAPQGPQPPNPGEASMPAQPQMAQGPMPGGQPPMGAPPMPPQPMAQGPMPGGQPPMGSSPVGGGPPGPPSQPPPGASPPGGGMPAQGGMPQFDLQTLVQRIQTANPNLPPQAMVAAITRATPLLNLQGKIELAQMRAEQRQQALDTQEGFLDLKRQRERGDGGSAGAEGAGPKGLMSPAAIDAGAERYLKTGQLPPNLGRGVQGRADMAAIQNRAADLAKEQGIKTADLPKKWQEQKAEQIAIQRFMSGPQGNTVRSLNVIVDHLATMRDLALALENSNIQAFNRAAQAWAQQTGKPAPTNLDTAKQIIGTELIKALGASGAGGVAERLEAGGHFSREKSPEQLMGAIKVAQRLLSGQVGGLRKQFVTATGLKGDKFDEMLGDEAKGFLNAPAEKTGGKSVPASGGWSIQRMD